MGGASQIMCIYAQIIRRSSVDNSIRAMELIHGWVSESKGVGCWLRPRSAAQFRSRIVHDMKLLTLALSRSIDLMKAFDDRYIHESGAITCNHASGTPKS